MLDKHSFGNIYTYIISGREYKLVFLVVVVVVVGGGVEQYIE